MGIKMIKSKMSLNTARDAYKTYYESEGKVSNHCYKEYLESLRVFNALGIEPMKDMMQSSYVHKEGS